MKQCISLNHIRHIRLQQSGLYRSLCNYVPYVSYVAQKNFQPVTISDKNHFRIRDAMSKNPIVHPIVSETFQSWLLRLQEDSCSAIF